MARNNRTVRMTPEETATLRRECRRATGDLSVAQISDTIFCQDMLEVLPYLPSAFADLVILDPPYNLTKQFRENTFRARENSEYAAWIESWLGLLPRVMKPTASLYLCADWRMGAVVAPLLEKFFIVRNRITWEREKGRGASSNWKNCAEDIWFATVSDKYTFHADAVKLKRRVLAPYRDDRLQPKDWQREERNAYRLTAASNLWTDITVPFWSMPENTEHPTQKPEKLMAKLILASSDEGDVVFDPFLGSGTTAVTARKLNRRFVGIESDEHYCCLALKRLAAAKVDNRIQGMADGVFWERNTLADQQAGRNRGNGGQRRKS